MTRGLTGTAPGRLIVASFAFVFLLGGCKGFGTRAPQAAVTVTATPSWEDPVADLFVAYCNDCHGPTPQEGAPPGVRTDILADEGGDLGVVTLFDRHLARSIDSGRPMPPPPAAMMTADEVAMLRTWASLGFPATVAEAQAATPAPSGAGCEPGSLAPCACVQGYWGYQRCDGESGYGACECGSNPDFTDAGTAADTGGLADAGGADVVVDPNAPTLTELHTDVLAPRCAQTDCHATGRYAPDLQAASGLADRLLGPSVQARGVPYVTPGNADQSYLYVKCLPDFSSRRMGYGAIMPSDGTTLSAAEIDAIRAWINGGAQP